MSSADADNSITVGLWNDLPDLILSEVYSYLSLNDRIAASTVCKNWSQGFHAPKLWKSLTIILNGDPNRRLPDCDERPIVITEETEQEMEVSDGEESGIESVNANSKEENMDESGESATDNESLDVKVNLEYDSVSSTLRFNDEQALMFAEKYGIHAKELQLICEPMSKALSDAFQKRIANFLKSLIEKNCQLQDLTVFFSTDEDDWDKVAKRNLIVSFCEFLKSQNQLETVIFGNPVHGEEVCLLKAAVTNSGTSLKTLHCLFFNDEDPKGSNQETYCSSLSQLTKLHTAILSIQSLTSAEIGVLNKIASLKLQIIYDLGSNRDVGWQIEDYEEASVWPLAEWRQGLRIHPIVEDDFGGEYWLKCPTHPTLRVPLKPKTYINVQFKSQDNDAMNEVLTFILRNYSQTLVSLNIADRNGHGKEDDLIKDLVSSCKELRELYVNTYLSVELLEFICQQQSANNIDLKTFYFWVDSLEAKDTVNDLLKQYGNLMSARNWEYDLFGVLVEDPDTEQEAT